jgi:hypothetical protein
MGRGEGNEPGALQLGEISGLKIGSGDARMFDIYRDGVWKTRLEADGMLSALVKFGQENPEADPNAIWTVEVAPE